LIGFSSPEGMTEASVGAALAAEAADEAAGALADALAEATGAGACDVVAHPARKISRASPLGSDFI
jgi:hypothetical protein